MPVIEASGLVAATPQEFFDAAITVNQIPGYGEWHPAFMGGGVRIVRLTEGVGTTFEFMLQGTGATARAEVLEHTPERFVAKMSGGIFADATATWTAVPRGASCTVTYSFSYRTRYRPFSYVLDALLLRPRLRRLAVEQIDACKRRAEQFAARGGQAAAK
jgi:hypothetical protein